MKDEDWDRVLETNLKGAFLMTRAASKAMVRAKTGGRIINIASTAGAMATPARRTTRRPRRADRADESDRTRAGALGILVNAVAPGLIETDMAAALPAERPRRAAGASAAQAHRSRP